MHVLVTLDIIIMVEHVMKQNNYNLLVVCLLFFSAKQLYVMKGG
jgi:hypothetical protein